MAMDTNASLCKALLMADSEDAVIGLLREAGYWDKSAYWRHYGDVENNWGQSGNQQSLAEAALAEKIVNSVDARLMDECMSHAIDPKASNAPSSVRSAIARFFENRDESIAVGGFIEEWNPAKIRTVAEQITLCATGVRPKGLNITIADCGEGQCASRLPETILSLNRSNKMYVPFVQGQFNQGGTGALRFCGNHNLQLVISRRNPNLLNDDASGDDHDWCFTVVRRERPVGRRKNSIYTYLAPIGMGDCANDREGSVLIFSADSFGIFPDDAGPYERHATHGTAIKLYDYKFIGDRSNILRGRSLRSRLDLLLPEIALPVRVFEYRRDRRGKYLDVGSRRTTISGLLRRIKDSPNVEQGFPVSVPLQPAGEKLIAHIYAFVPEGTTRIAKGERNRGIGKKLGGARSYRKREGVLFLRNGQTQGTLPTDFFRRDAIKIRPIANDLLVFVDCDEISDYAREDLFMPSRDRLAENDFKRQLVDSLEKSLRECQELKDLRNRRQQERMSARLKDENPLADVLQSLIRTSPNLTTLLRLGNRISVPFRTQGAGSNQRVAFKGVVYPTFFKCKGVAYGTPAVLSRPINHRVRLTFETDARNDYFTRPAERGVFDLVWESGDGETNNATMTGPRLKNGIATVMLDLPNSARVGDKLNFLARVSDPLTEFENQILITVKPNVTYRSGGSGSRLPPSKKRGKHRELPTQVAPPQITRVYREHWESEGFNESTAMRIEPIGYTEDETVELYEFKINMDNTSLLNESKEKRLDEEQHQVLGEQFLYANVLFGLSLLLEDKKSNDDDSGENDTPIETIEDRIEHTCRALAPFVPALVSLGKDDLESDHHVDGLELTG